jgi:hypothetical protein
MSTSTTPTIAQATDRVDALAEQGPVLMGRLSDALDALRALRSLKASYERRDNEAGIAWVSPLIDTVHRAYVEIGEQVTQNDLDLIDARRALRAARIARKVQA